MRCQEHLVKELQSLALIFFTYGGQLLSSSHLTPGFTPASRLLLGRLIQDIQTRGRKLLEPGTFRSVDMCSYHVASSPLDYLMRRQ